MGTELSNWADPAMFRSEKHDASEGPKVHLLHMSSDPLGQIAACAKMYKGEVVRNLGEIHDSERRHYLTEMQKTKLKMPLEAVSMHFMIENVTRAFTHQLVRQRTAAYAQESMRFAVVEDMNEAVALPPSLAWTQEEVIAGRTIGEALLDAHGDVDPGTEEFSRLPTRIQQFLRWRHAVAAIGQSYEYLVNSGIPAEDARGLMPTNIVTRINYITNLRGLLDHAGNRLCTQAQFEWRAVFAQIAQAIRNYAPATESLYLDDKPVRTVDRSGAWQFDEIAKLLQPVCYQIGKCAFGAEFDRSCKIRSRVNANAEINRPSSEWGRTYTDPDPRYEDDYSEDQGHVLRPNATERPVFIGAISPREWLADPGAAR